MQTLIHNAVLVLPERLIEGGWLLIEDERIAGLGESATRPGLNGLNVKLDAGGSFLLPGLVDLHCDAIEKVTEPRPGVTFDVNLALLEVDQRLASCGITTEFHAIALDDNEFGTRSIAFAREIAQAIKSFDDNLIRHEFHARFEVTSQNGFEMICEIIKGGEARLVSLMDHSPGQGQYTSEQTYRDYVKRTYHRTDEQIDALLANKREQTANAQQRIEVVAALCREAGMALATHDDDTPAKIDQWPALGVTMAEFPTTPSAAKRAKELGLAVCMGAPNALRGKSSGGNLSALATIQDGLCDVLCADYHPAAMLASIFTLAAQNIVTLAQATRLVTLNPAHAVSLDKELGSLEEGKLADLILVSLTRRNNAPRVQGVFVGGRERLRIS